MRVKAAVVTVSSLLTRPSLTSACSLAWAGEPMKRSNGSVGSRRFVKRTLAGVRDGGNEKGYLSCVKCIFECRHCERLLRPA